MERHVRDGKPAIGDDGDGYGARDGICAPREAGGVGLGFFSRGPGGTRRFAHEHCLLDLCARFCCRRRVVGRFGRDIDIERPHQGECDDQCARRNPEPSHVGCNGARAEWFAGGVQPRPYRQPCPPPRRRRGRARPGPRVIRCLRTPLFAGRSYGSLRGSTRRRVPSSPSPKSTVALREPQVTVSRVTCGLSRANVRRPS